MEAADYEARAAQLRHVADVARAGGGAAGVAEVRPSTLLHCSVYSFPLAAGAKVYLWNPLCCGARDVFTLVHSHAPALTGRGGWVSERAALPRGQPASADVGAGAGGCISQ